MLKKGEKAPEFTLQDKEGKTISLSDFLGKKVVLYFYPKDNTPGCTRQACAFAGAYDEFIKSLNAQTQQKNDPVPQQKNDPPVVQNDPPVVQNDQLADAQAKYDAACKKAGDAKTALENAQKNLNAAKASEPAGDHSALEAAVTEAKAAFDAANKELVDAKTALEALQAKK